MSDEQDVETMAVMIANRAALIEVLKRIGKGDESQKIDPFADENQEL